MKFKYICFFILHYLASSCLSRFAATQKMSSIIQKNDRKNKLNAIEEDSANIELPDKTKQKTTKQAFDSVFEKTNMRNSYGRDNTLLPDIILYTSTSGCIALKNLESEINNYLKLIKYPGKKILQDTLDDYYDTVEVYAAFMFKQMVTCELEREFYILEFIDLTNKLLANQSYVLLNKMMLKSSASNTHKDGVATLKKYIDKAVTDEKSDNFVYICDKLNICRLFPAFSDRIAEILNEIILLTDAKFQALLILLNDITVMKKAFLKSIMDVDVTSKLRYLEDNPIEAREVFITLKSIINKRHNIFRSENGGIKLSKKALRVLIDIFDKSFETISDYFIRTEVEYVINGLRAWIRRDTIDIQKIVAGFMDKVEKGLENVLELPEMRIEAKTLIDIIVNGTSKYIVMVDGDLFTKGSKFVNHHKDNFQSQSELIEPTFST